MFKFKTINSFFTNFRKYTQKAAPKKVVDSSLAHHRNVINQNENWLRQQPRTAMDIACHLFGGSDDGMKEIAMTFQDMFPALEEAGYIMQGSNDLSPENSLWVKI